MKRVQGLLAVISILATPAVFADAKLAEKNACMACHAVDTKKLGPAYKAVAAKYATDKEAVTKLAVSIKAGGAGKWGVIPMPAQVALSEADAKTLAAWIMSNK